MEIPRMKNVAASRVTTDKFYGYNHNLTIGEGEWFLQENMTTDYFPLLATRRLRCIRTDALEHPQAIFAKGALAWIDGPDLYYGGQRIAGLTLSTVSAMLPKQMVSMGAYLVIFPDKVYLNTEDLTDYGQLEHRFTSSGTVTVSICREDGSEYRYVTSEPAEPKNGDQWLDMTQTPPVLKQYGDGVWVELATTFLRIAAAGIGAGFSPFDGITISGMEEESLNGGHVLYAVHHNEDEPTEDYLVVPGVIAGVVTQETAMEAARTVPDMDYVCECGNRLWGCKYGMVDGKAVNELYASKLGDFKNWNCFLGIATDSWAASRGSDGPWTGAISVQGQVLFFKENCLEKIYPSDAGAHQVTMIPCQGVQSGCWRSMATVGSTLIYKGRSGVCSYDGSLPVQISSALGEIKYEDARAGAVGSKYYISMRNGDRYSLFAYDLAKGLWTREDATKALMFAQKDGELFFIDEADGKIKGVMGSLSGTEGWQQEAPFAWSTTSWIVGLDDYRNKRLSRVNLRGSLEPEASCVLELEYDSEGVWRYGGRIERTGLRSFLLPVRPRRCDHLRIRLSGTGGAKVYAFNRTYEKGADKWD
jgi:hypothetical protein